MGTLTLRLALGAAALLFASGAAAQVDPKLERAARSPGQFGKAMFNATSVTVQDRDGDALSIVYRKGPAGARRMEFRDAEGGLINVLGMGSPPPPAAGGGQNPLFGDSIPPLPDTSPVEVPRLTLGRGDADGRSDTNSELLHLVGRINDLTRQVQILTTRLNVAAAKR
jgi:hypothetical protein